MRRAYPHRRCVESPPRCVENVREEVDNPFRRKPMDDDHADDLLRRALIDAEASAAVALRVPGLPLCDTLTVVFHGRRDLGTIQTYVAHGGRGAGAAVSRRRADARAVRPRPRRRRGPRGGRAAVRRAGRRAARRAGRRRHRARHLARAAARTSRARAWRWTAASSSTSACPPTGCCRPRSSRPSGGSSSPPCAAPGRWPRAARRWGSPAPSRTSRACTRCPTTRSAAWRTSSRSPPTTRARWRERLGRQEASVERFLELSGDDFHETG